MVISDVKKCLKFAVCNKSFKKYDEKTKKQTKNKT